MNTTNNLVMVHGLLGSLSYFNPGSYLSGINVITPDMYGYADEKSIDDLSLSDQASYIENLIQKNNISPAWILGHSVGGAIGIIVAAKHPELIKGIINVEGNFSLDDAFWCQKIASSHESQWDEEYTEMCQYPENWLTDAGIELTPERVIWAKKILAYQSSRCVWQMAQAVIKDTRSVEYQQSLDQVIKNKTPVHLIAGEFSANDWNIPDPYKNNAKSFYTVRNAGHMMMLEQPEEFCRTINAIIFNK